MHDFQRDINDKNLERTFVDLKLLNLNLFNNNILHL